MKKGKRRKVAKPSKLTQQAPVIKGPQPSPYKFIYLAWGALSAITICLGVYFHSRAETRVVYSQTHNLQPGTSVVYSDPIELKSPQNLQVGVYAPLDNSWAWVGGDFINEESGMVEEFELPIKAITVEKVVRTGEKATGITGPILPHCRRDDILCGSNFNGKISLPHNKSLLPSYRASRARCTLPWRC